MHVTGLYDIDIERQFLGAAIHNPSELQNLEGGPVDPLVFSDPKNRAVWEAVQELVATNSEFDVFDLTPLLRKSEAFKGGSPGAYAIELKENQSCVSHPGNHLETLRSLAWRRELVSKVGQIAVRCEDPGANDSDIAARVETLLTHSDGQQDLTAEPIGSFMQSYVDEVCSGSVKSVQDGIKMPFPGLHRRLSYLEPGQLMIIGGPPSMGKTSFLIGIVRENLSKGKKLLYISLDESKAAVVRRLLANRTNISAIKMRDAVVTEKEKEKLCLAAAPFVADDRLFLIDSSGLSVGDIASLARRVKRRYGLDGILVDYLGQIAIDNQESRTLQVGSIVRGLKVLAKDLEVPCIALSQLNRSYDKLKVNELPRPSMLRDSGEIEQEANIVLFPWIPLEFLKRRYGETSPKYKNALDPSRDDHAAYIVIAKNKEGETFLHKCRWHPKAMRFFEESPNRELF
ncbi:MAG: AAA family ATPase [candidate division Zixibacteria bacterium]|nr:AAA family ATPase [candidate division Zixibacteria bacterium]